MGADDLEHPELDVMLERVKLTRGYDDKLSCEVRGACRVSDGISLL